MSDPNEEAEKAIRRWTDYLYAVMSDGYSASHEALRDLVTSVVEATREQCAELADQCEYVSTAVESIRSAGLPSLKGPK